MTTEPEWSRVHAAWLERVDDAAAVGAVREAIAQGERAIKDCGGSASVVRLRITNFLGDVAGVLKDRGLSRIEEEIRRRRDRL